jgi:hypothetical protein
MKKFLLSLVASSVICSSLLAQDTDFDKKFRFGLRVTPQPTWFLSSDKNNVPSGAKFGFGFGLNMEFRFSEIAGLLTGIGADFEGAKYKFRNDPGSNYEAVYWMNESSELVEPTSTNKTTKSNTAFVLKERTVKSTYVTIPVILKLSTKEYNGFKYSGMFGGEIGVRIKAKADDSYYSKRKYVNDTLFSTLTENDSQTDINISKESSLVPIRICFNAGLGVEYRLGGSTSAFVNINYFRSLSNQMRKESEYTIYKTEPSSGKSTFIKQNLKMSGIRISVGIMF